MILSAWRGAIAACAVVAAALYGLLIARTTFVTDGRRFSVLADDPMVSMRYARNLAHGEGLVWNPGQHPVEGYTNFLWTLVMAIPHALGLGDADTSLAIMGLGGLILIATFSVVYAIVRDLIPERRWPAILSMSLTAFYYPLVYWTLRGFEVGLAALLVALMALLALRSSGPRSSSLWVLAGLTSAAVLLRDDLVVPTLVVLCFTVLMSPRSGRLRLATALGGSLLVTLAAHTIFRILYYGDALPNTYYLKVGEVSLATRAQRGFEALAGTSLLQLWVPLVLAGYGAFLLRTSRRREGQLLVALVIATCAYSVYVGGDSWELFQFPNRFIASVVPLLFVLVAVAIHSLLQDRRQSPKGLFVLVTVLAAGAALAAWPPHFVLREARVSPALAGDRLGSIESVLSPARVQAVSILVAVAVLALTVRVRRIRIPVAVVLVLGALLLSLDGEQAVEKGGVAWQTYTHFDSGLVRIGLDVRRLTTPAQSIAVLHAGSIPYFSHRTSIDLLGKNDPVIAHERPRPGLAFLPGHVKWDYRYSIGRLRPDVVVALWTPKDVQSVERAYGYVRCYRDDPILGAIPGGGLLYRRSAINADLRRSHCTAD
jgi:hypothetical protein